MCVSTSVSRSQCWVCQCQPGCVGVLCRRVMRLQASVCLCMLVRRWALCQAVWSSDSVSRSRVLRWSKRWSYNVRQYVGESVTVLGVCESVSARVCWSPSICVSACWCVGVRVTCLALVKVSVSLLVIHQGAGTHNTCLSSERASRRKDALFY
jgi:hypothetical protein